MTIKANTKNSNKQTIVFIGSGNVTSSLSLILSKKYNILQVFSRNIENAKSLSKKINTEYTDNIEIIKQNADYYIFSIIDDELLNLLKRIKFKMKFAIHTSGSLSIDLLKNFSANYGLIYPLQTFDKNRNIDIDNISIFIDGNNSKSIKIVKNISKNISKNIYQTSLDERIKIHIAAIFINNFSNHMISLGKKYLSNTNLDFSILKPLLIETFNKLITQNPEDSQTGPAIRNDKKILKKHINILSEDKELQKIYKFVSESIINFHHKND